jgi:hypothetical protein
MVEISTANLEKLQAQANELRGAMIKALGDADDNTSRKLGNELVAVNRSILDIEVQAQGSERDAYRDAMHDALNTLEVDGFTLTVKYNAEDGVSSIAFAPTAVTIDAIKAAVATITRPSSAKQWVYGRDESGYQSFDFSNTKRAPSNGNGDGTRTVGWVTPSGSDISLGKAFDACATPENLTAIAELVGGSKTNAYKVQTITKAGYTKK